jgi:acyl dehydratase
MSQTSLKDASVGDAMPETQFGPITRATLALYAGASGDHNPVHIDSDFAREAGLPDVFAHGMLSFGALAQLVTRWAGVARVRSFGARFISITQVNDVITCRGQVTERFEEAGEACLRVAITATAQDGRQTLAGEAIVAAN